MKIRVVDHLDPETSCMLQALYSRSAQSVDEHMVKVQDSDVGAFVERYYVGFGHKSIADCGSTTVFIEDVSMLAAKAIQDWPLYNGQESSTRYIDFSKQRVEDPVGTEESRAIQARWMQFYFDLEDPVLNSLRERYPRLEGEDFKTYERAIHARGFDIRRGFIPAGATTNLSWHTELRQAADKLAWLQAHPDPVIRNIGDEIRHALHQEYPHSFGHMISDEILEYRRSAMAEYAYSEPGHALDYGQVLMKSTIPKMALMYHREVLESRPRGAELLPMFAALGQITSEFLLDFGSFRDLQRHRNGVVEMPLLTTEHGFSPWYVAQIPEEWRTRVVDMLAEQCSAIQNLTTNSLNQQYYCAMGFLVECCVTQGLPAFVYRMELRSGKTVHPTLRRTIHEEIKWFQEQYPVVRLHVDTDPDDWTLRRGRQTIEAKEDTKT